jgi:TonB-dependent SusC/RagA subfamily outer membrane receptor
MKQLILLLFTMLFSLSLLAQQRVVSGKVTVFEIMNLANIKVESKKAGSVVTTDTLGNYQLICEQKDVITFNGKTFSRKRIRVKAKDNVVNANMKFLSNPENVEMAVGYGYISKENATTAYANLSSSQVDFCSYNNIYDLINGKCAGVNVGNASYVPGAEQDVNIRGVNSFNQSNPLYIVDGSPTSQIAHIVPCNVKSISFLKDSEAAIYGATGGAGVILIETKSGKDN